MGLRKTICLLVLWLGLPLYAELEFPSYFKGGKDRSKYVTELLRAEPWIIQNGNNREYIDKLITGIELPALKVFQNDKGYMKAAASRPALRTFTLRSYQDSIKETYALKGKASKPSAPVSDTVKLVSEQPLSSVLIGILQSLPEEIRKQGFKIGNGEERIALIKRALSKTKTIDLKKSFRADRYGIQGDAWGKADILGLIDRAQTQSIELVQSTIHLLSQNATVEFESKSEFLAGCQRILESSLGMKPNWKILKGEFELWLDDYLNIQKVETETAQYELTLREMPPFIALFRGCIGGNCATSSSAVYSYSPYERDFLVERNGGVIGHTSGTMVKVDGKPYFYLHDLKGQHMSVTDYALVLNGFLDNFAVLGAKGIILAGQSARSSIGWGADYVDRVVTKKYTAIEYYPEDQRFRSMISANHLASRTGYDDPIHNQFGQLPLKTRDRAGIGPTRFEDIRFNGLNIISVNKNTVLKPEDRLRILSLMRSGTDFTGELDPKENKNLKAALAALANKGRKGLDEFYEKAIAAFEPLGIKLSNHFFDHNMALFAEGHFSARDAFSNQDKKFQSRTLNLLMSLYVANAEKAGELLATKAEGWLEHPRIISMLTKSLTENGPAGINRIHQLHEKAVDVARVFQGKPEVLKLLWATGNQALTYDAIRKWVDLNFDRDDAFWVAVGSLLDNERAQNEDWAKYAAELLATAETLPSEKLLLSQINSTVRDEQDPEIRSLVSVAFQKNFSTEPTLDPGRKIYRRSGAILQSDPRPKLIRPAEWDALIAGLNPKFLEKEKEKEKAEVDCKKQLKRAAGKRGGKR